MMNESDMFDACIKSILLHEGYLSDDKRDPGKITKWGISLRFLEQNDLDINHDGKVNGQDILDLTQPEAINIYREEWWDKYGYSRFKSLEVVEKVFDMAVNMGAYQAHLLLQRACNAISLIKIDEDGKLGIITVGVSNSLDPSDLRNQLRIKAKDFYSQLLKKRPNMEWARKGWMNRAKW